VITGCWSNHSSRIRLFTTDQIRDVQLSQQPDDGEVKPSPRPSTPSALLARSLESKAPWSELEVTMPSENSAETRHWL
jgi:hypothetical protein